MDRLKAEAMQIAEEHQRCVIATAARELRAALPERYPVDLRTDGLTISGPGLVDQIIGNSALRDVAFLMRGVR